MALDFKSEVKEVSPVEREVSVIIPGAQVAKELDKAYRKLSQKVRMKGYRPGKVPRYVLEKYYKRDTEADVLERIVGQSYSAALQNHELTPVAEPKIQAAPELIAGMDYSYQATVEVKPEIELKKYKGLEFDALRYEYNPEDVDTQLESMRERQTQVVPVEDRDTIQQGDLAECNFSGKIEDEVVKGLGGVSYVIEVGGGRFYKEAEQALVGKKVGESFDVEVAVPEDHRVEAARGKTATLSIKTMEIKTKVKPDLDDEFAKDVSDSETLDELKQKLAKDLEAMAERNTNNARREAAVDALIEANPFEVPSALVERQAQQMAADQLRRLPQQQAEMIWAQQHEKLTEQTRPRALRGVRGGLLLEKLVEEEAIEVSDEKLEERFAQVAIEVGQSVAQVKKIYKQQGAIEDLQHQIATEIALDRVIEAAKITDKIKGADSDEAEG